MTLLRRWAETNPIGPNRYDDTIDQKQSPELGQSLIISSASEVIRIDYRR